MEVSRVWSRQWEILSRCLPWLLPVASRMAWIALPAFERFSAKQYVTFSGKNNLRRRCSRLVGLLLWTGCFVRLVFWVLTNDKDTFLGLWFNCCHYVPMLESSRSLRLFLSCCPGEREKYSMAAKNASFISTQHVFYSRLNPSTPKFKTYIFS